MKVWQLLSDESKWTKNCYARDRNEFGANHASRTAVKWCLIGAMLRCYDSDDLQKINGRVEAHLDNQSSTSSWNDAPERTFAEVHALVKELDI